MEERWDESEAPQEPALRAGGGTGGRDRDRIRFDDFLKLSGRVRSGGEGKRRIQSGEILVNGTAETHRSRKLSRGDRVTIDGEDIEVKF